MTYQYAELAGARIAYRASGSGPALVLMKNNRRPPDYPIADTLSKQFRVLQIAARSTDRATALVMGGVSPIGFPTDGEMRRLEREPRLPRPALEFWRGCRSYDWHHELRLYPGVKVAYLGTADPAIRRLRKLRPVLQGIGFTYLEFEGLTHSTCGLGDASADGRRVAQAAVDCLVSRGDQRREECDSNSSSSSITQQR
ncbi:hypothetical protein ACIA58_01830 [Kribbella sp. NPDC051586]|uniref:hypothetical protein n=1 Tax=Kribbella sp. NPDC051586 TaxID=3364118 RepID=UPI003794E2DF